MNHDKVIEDEGRAFAEEFVAQLKREGCVFKKSDKAPSYYEEIYKKDMENYNKLLETGIVDMLMCR